MITTTVSFIVVLGILIFIHELGHFAVAKWSGVGVEKFSLGFGPKLIGITYGETEYRLSLLPLGGYVKMTGENPGEEVSDFDKARSFNHKRVGTRALIVVAGPVMNLVLAVILFPIIFMIGISVPAYLDKAPVVAFVAAETPASIAGVQKGDKVLSIDGEAVDDWESFLSTVILSPNAELQLVLERAGKSRNVSVTPVASETTGGGYLGIHPPMRPVVGTLSKGYPAEKAGLLPGDLILAIDGTEITHWAELEKFIKKSGVKRTFLVERAGATFTVDIEPKQSADTEVFLIGISRDEAQVLRRYGFSEAVVKGIDSSYKMTAQLFTVIKGLVVGQYSMKTLGGPIMIAQVAGSAAKSGIADLLSLVAFLSLQLGIINLFPIPVLDGGHLLFFGVEAIKGKPLSERFMGAAQQVGVVLLVALMLMVTYNDFMRIFF
jgi:regulator of sigma E protease